MAMLYILIGSVTLIVGSMVAAALLTCSVSWIGERLCCSWLPPVLLLVCVAILCATPLEHSLFVRMLAVVTLVGCGLLYCVGRETPDNDGAKANANIPRRRD